MPSHSSKPRSRSRKNSIFGWPVKGLSLSNSSTAPLSAIQAYTPEPDDSDSHSYASQHNAASTTRHRRNTSTSQPVDISLSRSVSLRSTSTSGSTSVNSNNRVPSAAATLASYSPEKTSAGSRPTLSISTFGRNKQKSTENVRTLLDSSAGAPPTAFSKSPLSAAEANSSVGMQAIPLRHAVPPPRPPGTSHSNYSQSNGVLGQAAPIVPSANGFNSHAVFQTIHDTASKRISTLDYLRKAHEGRVYWFNTLLFTKDDLARLQFFEPRKLARRATNYLILGYSIPAILDLNNQSPTDYLKAFNALLAEFEAYQSMHPIDGSSASSLTRGRIPQMFKRNPLGGGKGRRSSSAADLVGLGGFGGGTDMGMDMSTDNDLLPGEEYSLLLTPSLPFDPDFLETFATLCDVLIDCYTKVMSLVNTPEQCSPSVNELFLKADTRVRKIVVVDIVKELESSSRQGIKGEMAGIGKVVLGGMV